MPPPVIPDTLWEQLLLIGKRLHYRAGEIIYFQNAPSGGVYCVESGRVKVSHILDDGTEAILAIFSRRCMFGELSAIQGEPASPAATAQTDMTVLLLPTETLHALMRTNPAFCQFMIRSLIHKLHTASAQLFTIAGKTVLRRLAATLLILDSYGIPFDSASGFYTITHADLAGLTGTTRSNATVILNQLSQQGLVALKRSGIRILCRRRLETLSRDKE